MPSIFIFIGGRYGPSQWGDQDVLAYALAEDGEVLASHYSSSVNFARHDMGITGPWKHERYAQHYPDGYDLVDLLDLSSQQLDEHLGFQAAFARNKALAIADEARALNATEKAS
jgi:hypothetical protein